MEIIAEGMVTGPNEPVEETTENPTTNTGANTGPVEPAPTEPDDTGAETGSDEEVAEVLEIAGLDMSELSKEYMRDGKLSEESYSELEEHGFPKAVVDAYIKGIEAQTAQAVSFKQEEISALMSLAGGAEKYSSLMDWAEVNLSADERDAYNLAVQGGNKALAGLAIKGLMSKYESEYGHEPKLIGGGGDARGLAGDAFASKSEMMDAMSDKRYGRDVEYTRSVEEKVIRSGLMSRKH